jgi:hypothetical protein
MARGGKGGGINIVLTADANQLKQGLAEARAALSKTADAAQADQKRLADAASKFTSQATNAGTLRSQSRALFNLAASYEDMGAAGSKAFRQTLQQAGQLRDRMGDLQMAVEAGHLEGRIKVFGNAMQSTIGIIAGAEGAMQMLGIKTEDAANVTAKLQSLMAMSQGIGSMIALNDAIKALTLSSSGFATVMTAVRALLMPGPVLAIGAAVAALALILKSQEKAVEKVNTKYFTLKELNQTLAKTTEESMGKFNMLTGILRNNAASMDMKKAALQNLQALYPTYFKGLDLEKSKNEEIKQAIDLATDSMKKRAMAMAVEQRMLELSNELIKKQIEYRQAQREVDTFDLKKGETEWQKAKQRVATLATEIVKIQAQSSELTKIAKEAGSDFVDALNTAMKDESAKKPAKLKVNVEIDGAGAMKEAQRNWAKDNVNAMDAFKGGNLGMPGAIDIKALEDNLKAAQGLQRQGIKKFKQQVPDKAMTVYFSDPKDMQRQYKDFSKYTDRMIDEHGRFTRTAAAQVQGFNQGLMQVTMGAADAVGQMMEDIFSRNKDWKSNFGKNILIAVTDFMKTLGKAMIAAAIASDTFQKALLTNPAVALAAGVGLVAAAGIVRGLMSRNVGEGSSITAQGGSADSGGIRRFASGGIISGPTVGLMGEYPGAKSNPEVVAPLNKLKDMIGGGMGGNLTARISGQDLLIMLDRAETSRGRVR